MYQIHAKLITSLIRETRNSLGTKILNRMYKIIISGQYFYNYIKKKN